MMATTERNAGDAIRARAPDVMSVYQETREAMLEGGLVEREIKDLCALPRGGSRCNRAGVRWESAVVDGQIVSS
jgi:hypothetical protein